MAKQTYTVGQILTAAQMTTLQANDYNQTVSAKVASYTLVASDAGTRITMSNAAATTITVNTALFAAGDTLIITNIGAGVCTITAGTATVSTGGSLALAQYDSGTLYFTSTGVSIWNGVNPGDITGVTASTGLSGGGTSGTVSLAIDSTVATLTGTQTLTNKTLTSPALTTPTISTLTTNGDLLYGTGSGALARLGIGSNGNVLSVASGLPAWSAPAGGGGKVLQVVSAVITTATTIATTTMTDTAITLSITPTLNTSKVLVLINGLVNTTRSINTYGIASNVVRGSTDILTSGYDSYYGEIGSAGAIGFTNKLSYMVLDSPATTSSTTYKLQANVFQTSSSHSSVWQKNSYPSVITLMEIGA